MTQCLRKGALDIIHSDQFLNSERNGESESQRIVRTNIRNLLLGLQTAGKRIYRIDSSVSVPDKNADVYVISDTVSSLRALEVVNPGDEVFLAGLFRDVCLAMVYRESQKIGANPSLIPGTSLDQDLVTEWDSAQYIEMLQRETIEFGKKLAELQR